MQRGSTGRRWKESSKSVGMNDQLALPLECFPKGFAPAQAPREQLGRRISHVFGIAGRATALPMLRRIRSPRASSTQRHPMKPTWLKRFGACSGALDGRGMLDVWVPLAATGSKSFVIIVSPQLLPLATQAS